MVLIFYLMTITMHLPSIRHISTLPAIRKIIQIPPAQMETARQRETNSQCSKERELYSHNCFSGLTPTKEGAG